MKVVFLGAGNVATHLALALDRCADVLQVYSRNLDNATRLAQSLRKASAINDLSQLLDDADVYIVSVKDDVISRVISQAKLGRSGLWVHTSGSIDIDVFRGDVDEYGVLYPLQTFSKGVYVDVTEVPFFIEACNEDVCLKIEQFAKLISTNIYRANSFQRRQLHIAAVFGCNFINYMWVQADEILQNAGYKFDILLPLIKATIEKAERYTPMKGQTGPARRGDIEVVKAHERELNEEQKEIYRLVSQCIMQKYNRKDE